MARGPVLSLRALPICLALVQLLSPCSAAQFTVVGPPEPILALVGEDAELPCKLSAKIKAETMELRWVRPSLRQVVHTYARGQEDTPAAEYRERTSMLRENITAGKAVLRIRDVRASDSGTYLCYFQDGDFFENAQVELHVAGPFFQDAQPCVVAFQGTLLALLGLLMLAGYLLRKIQALSYDKDRERAEKEAALAEKAAAQKEKEEAVAEKKAAQAEKEAALAEKAAAQKEKEEAVAEKKAAQAEKEAALVKEQRERSAKERLQDELRWTKTRYRPRGKLSKAYAEWKMALFQPADVFLDPDTAHPALCVSEDKRSLQRALKEQNLPYTPGRFYWNECVLGSDSFTSGRHFWEVNVGDREQWHVGLCRDNVERKCWVQMTPENGFWVIGLYFGKDFGALTDSETKLSDVKLPTRVGVFLDYEVGEVSFYNALEGSHIFTFPHTPFSGPLRPVFKILSFEDSPLTLCAAQKAVGTTVVPDPAPEPPPETPTAPPQLMGMGTLRLK